MDFPEPCLLFDEARSRSWGRDMEVFKNHTGKKRISTEHIQPPDILLALGLAAAALPIPSLLGAGQVPLSRRRSPMGFASGAHPRFAGSARIPWQRPP